VNNAFAPPPYPPPLPAGSDQWHLWPTVILLAAWSLSIFFGGLPGSLSFILIPVSTLAFMVSAAALLVFVCVFVSQRRLRIAASMALALLAPLLLSGPISWTADCLHMILTVKFGIGILNKSGALIDTISIPPTPEKPFQSFDWSVGLAGGTNTFLIFDKTDKMALPRSQYRPPSTGDDGFGDVCAGRSRHLVGHYYVCNL
jgi:hypothetical protein